MTSTGNHPAKVLKFRDVKYNFARAKRNILIYVCEPAADYYGEYYEGNILVVEYIPNRSENESYYVLHQIETTAHSITPINLSEVKNRMAEPYINE